MGARAPAPGGKSGFFCAPALQTPKILL